MRENFIVILFLLIIFSPVIYQLIIVIKEHKKGRELAKKRLIKFLKVSICIFIPTSIFLLVLNHINYLDYERPISYEKIDQITFENFRGIELFKMNLDGNKKFAYVVTSIEVDISDNLVEIKSFFHPSRSFVYDKHTNSEDLLVHEKYHFKITELFARRARKEIKDLEYASKKKINKILKRIKSEERIYQKKYDYDTYHSYIFSEQKKYERSIDSLLSLLKDYENPTIIFNEKD